MVSESFYKRTWPFSRKYGEHLSVLIRISAVITGPAGHYLRYSNPKTFTHPWNQCYVQYSVQF